MTESAQFQRQANAAAPKKLKPASAALDQFPMQAWKRCVNVAQASSGLLQSAPLAWDEVLVEAPGYQGTYDVVAQTGARIQSISWQTLQQQPENTPNAKLLCLTPSRNFPLGHTLGLSSRLTLLAWAEQHQSWILAACYLADWPIIDAGGGMYLVLAMPETSDDVGLCQSLAQQSFGVRHLSVYDPLTRQSGLVLGFSAEPEAKLASLVMELAALIGAYQTIHTQ